MSDRGSQIDVPAYWLEACEQWRKEQNETLVTLGQRLAKAIDRRAPYVKATVSRYLSGHTITDDMTEAFAKLMGVPHPVYTPATAEQRRWCDLGSRLEAVNAELFSEELQALKTLVEAEETASLQRQQRKQSRKSRSIKRN